MAKKRKSFKSLPKRSKAAAFAKMSTAGKLKKKDKSGKRTGAAIPAKGASSAKPKAKVTSKPKAKVKQSTKNKKAWDALLRKARKAKRGIFD